MESKSKESPLDLESLRLAESLVGVPRPPKRMRGLRRGPFAMRVPRHWMLRAYRAGAGSGAMTGLALWYMSGVKRGERTVRLTNLEAARWGVTRQSKWTALAALEAAGLISIQRRHKTSPLVTLIDDSEDEVDQ
jgi:hypothetical protein